MKTTTSLLALVAALPFIAASSHASITGVTGSTTLLGSPPVACGLGALTGFTAYAWDEQQNVPLASFGMDMTNNPGSSTAPVPGFISGLFDSHFIHFEPVLGVIGVTGTVTFSSQIIAADFRALSLDATDALLGSPGTAYPTGYPSRGVSSSLLSSFTISGNTLTFSLNVPTPPVDVAQIRVLTHSVPAPGAAALLGAGGLLMIRRRRK